MLTGGETSDTYHADRFSLYGDTSPPHNQKHEHQLEEKSGQSDQQAKPLPRPRQLPPPLADDAGVQSGGQGSPEPTQFGCWIIPQAAKNPTGGSQQVVNDRSATAAKTQVASQEAPCGAGSTLAAYDERTFRTPFEVAQDVIGTGAIINTYTNEICETFEDAMPPPNRSGGDPQREGKSASLRLQAAQGNELRRIQKKEIENPLPSADSGPIMENASFRQQQAVALEGNERCNRDKYFACNELVPTDPIMTTNPIGFKGFQNMLRINPYLLPTQELDSKNWAPNSDPIPTTARFLETRTRLHRDALAGRAGLAEGGVTYKETPVRLEVRATETQRNTREGPAPRGGNCLYAAPASATASAESVIRSLRGNPLSSDSTRGGGPLQTASRPDVGETDIRSKRGNDPLGSENARGGDPLFSASRPDAGESDLRSKRGNDPLGSENTRGGDPLYSASRPDAGESTLQSKRGNDPLGSENTRGGEPRFSASRPDAGESNLQSKRGNDPLGSENTRGGEPRYSASRPDAGESNLQSKRGNDPLGSENTRGGEPLYSASRPDAGESTLQSKRGNDPLGSENTRGGEPRFSASRPDAGESNLQSKRGNDPLGSENTRGGEPLYSASRPDAGESTLQSKRGNDPLGSENTRGKEPRYSASRPDAGESNLQSKRGNDPLGSANTRGGESRYYASRPDAGESQRAKTDRTSSARVSGARGGTEEASTIMIGESETRRSETLNGDRGMGMANGLGQSGQGVSAFGSSEQTPSRKRDAVPRRMRSDRAHDAPVVHIAAAEECRKTLITINGEPRVRNGELLGSTVLGASSEPSRKTDSKISQKRNGASQDIGTVVHCAESSRTRRSEGAATRPLADSGVGAHRGPDGERFLSDKRGVFPNERLPAYDQVVSHQMKRAPAPEPPQMEPEVIISITGKPDAVTTGRAFIGQQSREEKVRGPTPRRGGAERGNSRIRRMGGAVSSRMEDDVDTYE
jgi:hypothetical protein